VETFTASDGYRWQYRAYRSSVVPRAQVVCIHGIQSHAGWYEYSCTKLCEAAYAVYFLDRRGSGINPQGRGDAPGFRRLLDDVAEFVGALRANGLPLFLIGISWGGKVAVALMKRHPGLVDGLALLCPGFFAQVRPTLRERLAIAWSRLVSPRRLFPIPLSDPELFTATPQWQHFLRDDPLRLHQATARLLVESIRLDYYLRVAPSAVTVPVLLLLGGRDRIINNAHTRRYVERFATGDKRVIEYPDAHHTLEFEPDRDCFLADLQNWLDRHGQRLV
jgi:alpha-beta hydrolase superfamily lysophospholipase